MNSFLSPNLNFLHFLAFLIYALASFCAGVHVYLYLNKNKEPNFSEFLFFGETCLLGSIGLIGVMLLLSLLHLYIGWLLWIVVLFSYTVLFSSQTRETVIGFLFRKKTFNVTTVLFLLLLGFFMFRNCYFLVDVDSHSTYLLAQKLWLHHGTSILSDPGIDMRTFTPHFNAIPYALGIALFGEETLFAQMVVMWWTVIVLVLIFGYTKYRLGGLFGLAAALFVLLDDHMFYSGANICCVINSALVAFIFAAVYNFWEAREKNSLFRFVLAGIFLASLMANKYQVIYITVFIFGFGLLIQPNLLEKIRGVFSQKRWLVAVALSVGITALWYIKNWVATGCPTFPMLAGTFESLNWTVERQAAFLKGCGKLGVPVILKYLGYFFIWAGVVPAKYLWMCILFLPVFLLRFLQKPDQPINLRGLAELLFWLGLSILLILGIVLTNYTDPRVYRYNIAVLAFALAFFLSYVFVDLWKINKHMVGIAVLLLSLSGHRMFLYQGGIYHTPTVKENWQVLTNQLHMKDMIEKYFSKTALLRVALRDPVNSQKIQKSAWDTGVGGVGAKGISAFLLPVMPQVDLWHTSIIQWPSYGDSAKITADLKNYGLQYVAKIPKDQLVFQPIEQFAKDIKDTDRNPQHLFYDNNFPAELSQVPK